MRHEADNVRARPLLPNDVPEGTRKVRGRQTFALHLRALIPLALLLAACNLVTAPEAKGYDYAGTWRGSVTDGANGSGSIVATLDQSGYALTGTWHVVMADDAARQAGGAWTGQVYTGEDGDLLRVTLASAATGQCSYQLTLSREQDAIRGDYAPTGGASGCRELTQGTVQLNRP